jgi:hypothetical protein
VVLSTHLDDGATDQKLRADEGLLIEPT